MYSIDSLSLEEDGCAPSSTLRLARAMSSDAVRSGRSWGKPGKGLLRTNDPYM
jgi:hypothetical protein